MTPTRLQIAKRDIFAYLDALPSGVLKKTQIGRILDEHRQDWRLTASMTTAEFIEFLSSKGELVTHRFEFPSRTEIRYVWGELSDYALILSLKPECYLSHFTAMSVHELTLQVPKTIYVNFEQSAKAGRDAGLTQERIDFAFSRHQRVSRNIAVFRDKRVCMLNGMNTGQLGVTEVAIGADELARATNVERTLIDITVRPSYSGGVHMVLEAYRLAAGKVSINRLCSYLTKLNYLYPYHQAVGFYMEASGVYKDSQLALLNDLPKEFNFYLAHQMNDPVYNPRWKLYVPKDI